MSYAFPDELATQVLARWTTFVARHDRPAPPLPPVQELRYILETAYFASFAREEGRSLRFVMCCAPSTTVPRDSGTEGVPVIPFTDPRSLTVDVIRSLAPAVSSSNAAILVQYASGAGDGAVPKIAGVLNVGSSLARVRRGRAIYQRPAPYALLIDVRDAGELHVYRGGIKLATLKSGSLQDQLAFSEIEFLPISDLIARGLDVMRPHLTAPVREPARETSDFEWASLLNTILSIVNGLEAHGHGGTLLVAGPSADQTLPIRVKFDVDATNRMLSDRFIAFVNARHALVDAKLARKAGADVSDADLARLDDATAIAEGDLSNASEIIGRLSAVDGALVIGSDLRVLGFGTEIVLDASRPVTAYQATGHSPRADTWPPVDSESFGMRHRSALRCVAVADDTAAFVVSQDGTVSFFWKQGGRVLIKRGVTIANPNMGDA